MTAKRICHVRGLDLARTMSHRDVVRACNEIKQGFPETLFFLRRLSSTLNSQGKMEQRRGLPSIGNPKI